MSDQGSFKDLRKFLNGRIKGLYTNGLLEAIAVGDDINRNNIIAVKEQLFLATASGVFLDKLLAGIGITRPPGVGIDDALLREIAIKQTNSKLVNNIFLDVLEIFYGEDATRANVLSGKPEKYILADGMTLVIRIDTNDRPLTVTFKESDFSNIGLATAEEVANAISNAAFNQGYALTASVVLDNDTGEKYVQLLSGTKGPKSSITVIGGEAQNSLRFPADKTASPKINTQFTTSFNGPYVRFTWTSGPDPGLNFVDVGDYVNIYGSGYLDANRGYFTIENVQGGAVGAAFFEIINPLFKPQAPVTLSGSSANSGAGTVRRTIAMADAPTGAVRASNVVTITTTSAHGLGVGQKVRIIDVANTSFNGTFTVATAGLTTFTYAQAGPNAASGAGTVLHEATVGSPSSGAVRSSGTSTITTVANHGYTTGQVVNIFGVEDSSFNGQFTITGTTANTFTYTQDFSNDVVFYKPQRTDLLKLPRYATVYEVNPYEIVVFLPATTKIVKRELIGSWHIHETNTNTQYLGSYLFNPTSGLPIAKTATTLQETIGAGELKTVMVGANTSQFPDEEGFLVIGFGTSNEEGPIRYYGRPSSNSLLIDPSYKFKKSHVPGEDIALITDRKAYRPKQDGTDYGAYLTGTIAGRIEAQKLIEKLVASGIFLSVIITYPNNPGLHDISGYVYAGDPE